MRRLMKYNESTSTKDIKQSLSDICIDLFDDGFVTRVDMDSYSFDDRRNNYAKILIWDLKNKKPQIFSGSRVVPTIERLHNYMVVQENWQMWLAIKLYTGYKLNNGVYTLNSLLKRELDHRLNTIREFEAPRGIESIAIQFEKTDYLS